MTLELRGVSAGYMAGAVLHDVDLVLAPGEIVTLIGANGAGKSTLVKTISGLLPIMSGEIVYEGARIDTLTPAARVRRGIAHVPEGRQVFAGLTVLENLQLGGYARRKTRGEAERAAALARVGQRFPVLAQRMGEVVGNFSGGQQQMLAIARGLMAEPKLLILDEPSLGLSPLLVGEIFDLILGLRRQGISILLSEQNARMALSIADRGYVVENGRITLQGTGEELMKSGEIADRYLGGAGHGSGGGADTGKLAATIARLIG